MNLTKQPTKSDYLIFGGEIAIDVVIVLAFKSQLKLEFSDFANYPLLVAVFAFVVALQVFAFLLKFRRTS